MRKNMNSKTFTHILFIVAILCIFILGYFSYSSGHLRHPSEYETFANKNKRTMLDTDGNILGFDLIDHHDTFDFEPEMIHQHIIDV